MSVTLAYGDVVISDFETAWTANTNVTASVELTLRKVGGGAGKFIIASAFTTGVLAYKNISSMDLSDATEIKLWARCTEELTSGQLQVVFSTTINCGNIVKTVDVDAIPTADTYFRLTTSSLDMSACTAIVSIGLKIATDPGALDYTLYVDDLVADFDEMDFDVLSTKGITEDEDVVGFPQNETKQLLTGDYHERATRVKNKIISIEFSVINTAASREFLRKWFFARNHRWVTESSTEVEVVLMSKRFAMDWRKNLPFAKGFSVECIEKTARAINA